MAQTLKGYTSRDANRLLRRTGEPFRQAESYDLWVRDGRELERIGDNIENKPVSRAWLRDRRITRTSARKPR